VAGEFPEVLNGSRSQELISCAAITVMFPFGIVVLGIGLALALFYWSSRRSAPGDAQRADRAVGQLYRGEEPDQGAQRSGLSTAAQSTAGAAE
jgi:hypothetical protein